MTAKPAYSRTSGVRYRCMRAYSRFGPAFSGYPIRPSGRSTQTASSTWQWVLPFRGLRAGMSWLRQVSWLSPVANRPVRPIPARPLSVDEQRASSPSPRATTHVGVKSRTPVYPNLIRVAPCVAHSLSLGGRFHCLRPRGGGRLRAWARLAGVVMMLGWRIGSGSSS